jgi:hypothetical protein
VLLRPHPPFRAKPLKPAAPACPPRAEAREFGTGLDHIVSVKGLRRPLKTPAAAVPQRLRVLGPGAKRRFSRGEAQPSLLPETSV